MTLQLKAWHVSLVILLAGAVMSAYAVRVLFVDPVHNAPKVALAVVSQKLATATAVAPTPAAVGSADAPPAPPRQVLALTDRVDCSLIRGTEYRSESERAWYLANCVNA